MISRTADFKIVHNRGTVSYKRKSLLKEQKYNCEQEQSRVEHRNRGTQVILYHHIEILDPCEHDENNNGNTQVVDHWQDQSL